MSRALIAAILAAAILAGVAALDWYSRVAAGITAGGPVPLQSIPPRPVLPSARPSPEPSVAAPAAKPSVAPAASSSPAPVITQTPEGKPQIIKVSLSSAVASGGQIVTGTVVTTPDVTSVQAGIAGYTSPLTKVSEGYFALSYRVPELPPVLRRTYTIEIVARNAKGESASSSLPITIR